MSRRRYFKKSRNKLGLIAAGIGVGLIMAVLIPFWGWILAAGGGLIFIGWFLLGSSHH